MSGFYANWVKVQHPDKEYGQMRSEGFKKPFYFGASSIPDELGLKREQYSGSGLANVKSTVLKPEITANRQITGIVKSSNQMKPYHLPSTKSK